LRDNPVLSINELIRYLQGRIGPRQLFTRQDILHMFCMGPRNHLGNHYQNRQQQSL